MIVNDAFGAMFGMIVVDGDAPCYPGWMYTPQTLRAARALLDWTRDDLARNAGLSMQVVQKIEDGKSKRPSHETVTRIIAAFEAAGVEFLDPDKPLPPGGPGVRLRSSKGGDHE